MTLVLARFWILISTQLVLAGWVLSLFNGLGRAGYAIALIAIAGITWSWARVCGWSVGLKPLKRWKFRWRRWLPAGFAIVALMIVIGGLIHPPNNFDSLAYRVPRTLNWLAEGHWHWIDTTYVRLNTRSFVTEWTIAPILALTRSDRSIWIINLGMFLLLPGLIFSAFRGLGVGKRMSWNWMWIVPCADGVILQAGGAANDLPAVFFGVAAVVLAISARQRSSVSDAWMSMLSAALLTGLKPTNAPFGLLWLAVAWPIFPLLARKPVASTLALAASLAVSFVPSAVFNYRYSGDWTGTALELPQTLNTTPGLVFSVNCASVISGNLLPSVFPWSSAWESYWDTYLPAWFREEIMKVYGSHVRLMGMPQMPNEEMSAFGFALCWLAIFSGIFLWRHGSAPSRTMADRLVLLSPWVGILVVIAMMPAAGTPRYGLVYYPFLLLPILSRRGGDHLIRQKWWQLGACLTLAHSAMVLVISPVRPLWPAASMLGELAKRPNPPALVVRARDVYQTYGRRWDALSPVRAMLPADAKTFGLACHNNLEASLWRPFGERRFLHVTPGAPREKVESMHLRYLVVNESIMEAGNSASSGWLEEIGMERVESVFVKELASAPPIKWTLFRRRQSTDTNNWSTTHDER
jgi:hypothetical protein